MRVYPSSIRPPCLPQFLLWGLTILVASSIHLGQILVSQLITSKIATNGEKVSFLSGQIRDDGIVLNW